MEYDNKLVDFFTYCKKCEYENFSDLDMPCRECLDHAVNLHSKKPVKFKNKEEKDKTDEN